MSFKLSYKIFGAFLLTLLVIMGLMIGIMRFLAYRNFADYVNNVEMEMFNDLVKDLAAEFGRSRGWKGIRVDHERWRRILASHRPDSDMEGAVRPADRHGLQGDRPRPRGHDSRGADRPPRHPGPPLRERSPGGEGRRAPPPGHPPPHAIIHRLSLFDDRKRAVAGPALSLEGHAAREIEVDGRIVGWLGLSKRKNLSHPLDLQFVHRQTRVFYFIGGGALLLAALVSFFLSRHLLAPVKKLTKGTRALTSLDFETRIDVRSGDELGRLAADFNVMARTLKSYEQTRKQWVSDISHELRTPLSILRGEIEAMQDGVRKPDGAALDSLHTETLHIGKIVEDLHELSLAETGALHFNENPVLPIRLARESLDLFRPRFEKSGMAIRDDLEADENVVLTGDGDRLLQLFSNILENTLRYADSPGALRVWREDADGRLLLFFEDTGPGVPEEAASRLFDRLFRVDPSRSRAKGGSGLGLSICKNIVEAHGGKITATNATSAGLRIRIDLPLGARTK